MAATLTPELVVTGYSNAVNLVRSRVVAYAKAVWSSRGSYRDADIDALVAMIVPRVTAGQVTVANLTAAYIAQVASMRRGELVQPSLVDVARVTGGRGVPLSEVYRRPAVELYVALRDGLRFHEALDRSVRRLETLVATDVQMAKVRQSQASLSASGARFYRRVVKGSENCALCLLASTQRYKVSTLSPIHPGCDCDVDELPDDGAGSLVLDDDAVERLHNDIADRFGDSDRSGRSIDYRLISVKEHGEMGPLLTWRGQHFDGPSSVPE